MTKALLHDPLGFARMNHKFSTPDSTFMCGHALKITGVDGQTQLDELTALISTAFVENLLPKLCTDTFYEHGELILSDGFGEMVGTSSIHTAGSAGSTLTSIQIAMCLSIRTGDHYRGGHGRMYLGGLAASEIASDRTWNAGFVAEVETAWAAYLSTLDALTHAGYTAVSPGVIHRFLGKTEKDPHTFSQYTGTRVQRRLCSQRRRLGREL